MRPELIKYGKRYLLDKIHIVWYHHSLNNGCMVFQFDYDRSQNVLLTKKDIRTRIKLFKIKKSNEQD